MSDTTLQEMSDQLRTIPLTQGYFAVVDERDHAWLSQWKWHVLISKGKKYAKRCEFIDGKSVTVLMHRQILNVPSETMVDHRDGNGLNNCRHNLRPATNQENSFNSRGYQGQTTSKYKGVSWDKHKNKWCAYIRVNGKVKNLGRFTNEIDAVKAYDQAAHENYGEFAYLNLGAK